MTLVLGPANGAVADAVAAVFRDPAYSTTAAPPSLLQIVLGWIGRQLARMLFAAGSIPGVGVVLRVAIILAVILVLLRLLAPLLPAALAREGRRRIAVRADEDYLALAARLAAEERFADAAHALYRAYLVEAARRGELRLDDAKTSGDYLRELRGRVAPERWRAAREFAHAFERAVYGTAPCDAACYAALLALADATIPGGHAAGRERAA